MGVPSRVDSRRVRPEPSRSATPPRPFAWDALPRLTRAEARAASRCARQLPARELARALATSPEWLGDALGCEPLALETVGARALRTVLADPLCAAIVERASPLGARLALEIEPRLAAVVVDRVLGGTGDDAPPHPGALTEAERGVLAYVVARGLAAGAGGALRLSDVVTTPEALRVALGEPREGAGWLVWSLRVRVGAHVGMARAWIPEALLDRTRRPAPLDEAAAAVLGALSVSVAVESGRAALPASELAGLRAGDVVVLDAASARPCEGGLEGEVVARVRGGASRWRCALEPAGGDGVRLVVRAREQGPAVSRRDRTSGGARMDEDGGRAGARMLEAAGDVPVELVVELARFEMPLAEIAALAPGEVLGTGRALGERVLLRAGDRVVATGELVDVEGELGVRVLSLGRE